MSPTTPSFSHSSSPPRPGGRFGGKKPLFSKEPSTWTSPIDPLQFLPPRCRSSKRSSFQLEICKPKQTYYRNWNKWHNQREERRGGKKKRRKKEEKAFAFQEIHYLAAQISARLSFTGSCSLSGVFEPLEELSSQDTPVAPLAS